MSKKTNKIKYILAPLTMALFLCIVLFLSLSFSLTAHAAAESPEQTYNFYTINDFMQYSRAYAEGNRNSKDILNIAISEGSAISDDTFISLGTAAHPFAGTLVIPTAGLDTFLLSNCPLFNYVSTDMKITGRGTVKIQRDLPSETPAVGVLTSGSLFANHVVKGNSAATWNVELLPYLVDDVEIVTTYEGLIGTIADECDVTVNFTNTTSLNVVGDDDLGLICGSLGEDASLTVTTAGSGNSFSIRSSNGNAGGLVGSMADGATLTLASANNTRVSSVTATQYAGGLVGSAVNPTFSLDTILSYALSSPITGNYAGGLVGYYKTTAANETFPIDLFTFQSGLSVSGTTYAGGVAGYVDSECATLTFDGNKSGSRSFSFALPSGTYRGGIFGGYKTNLLTNTLSVEDLSVSVATSANDHTAGCIGRVHNCAAYIEMTDISANSTSSADAGLVADLDEGGAFLNVLDITVSGTFEAGIVDTMSQGVLRISGITDFSGFTKNSVTSGLIVKDRGRALVYAVGDGEGVGWTLKRNVNNAIDDVHSWGEVLRVDGSTLTENNLLSFDETAHTVTILAAVPSMTTVTHFALTALNIQLNTGTAIGSLRFTSGNANLSSTLLSGTLTIGANITLTGTGLTGLTRDDGRNAAFTGTLTGTSTLTLATGENYGLKGNGTALDADSKQGNIFRHKYSGLFAKVANGAIIENLTVNGTMNIAQTENDLYAGAIAAEAKGAVTLSNVTVSLTLNYQVLSDNSFSYGTAFGVGAATGLDLSVSDCDLTTTATDLTVSTIGRGSRSLIGGLLGSLIIDGSTSPTQSVSLENSTITLTYTKTTNQHRESCFGGVIGDIKQAVYGKGKRTVSIDNVYLSLTATGVSAAETFGGILGVDWLACDVTIEDLSVAANVTATGTAAPFGGLVQTATGGWDIRSITLSSASYTLPSGGSFGFVANRGYSTASAHPASNSTTETSNALYLEVNDYNGAYDIGALTFTGTPSFTVYDEIVAYSKGSASDLTRNGNAILSITTTDDGLFDTTGGSYETYLNKTAYGRGSGAINPNARYYYNLAYARTHTSTEKFKFLIWSVSIYAHDSLSDWFIAGGTFTGNLDLRGLSYYPVDFSGILTISAATLILDNAGTENSVHYAYRYTDNGVQSASTRSTRASTNQHYLMHASVLRNATGSISLSNVTFQGNTPRLSDDFCGFFVSGTLGGELLTQANCTLSGLIFDGAYILNGASHLTSNLTYAPLLINKIGRNSTLDWAGAQGQSYASYVTSGYYAASSLIGDVGDEEARAIYLTFSGMVFDARSTATTIDNFDSVYSTTRSIFSRASFLNSFRYYSESSGSYTFEIGEDRTSQSSATHQVTYGKEITTSVENADKQKKYYGSEFYTHPTTYQSESPYDFSTGFLPYVYVPYNIGERKHEIAVNVTFKSVIAGCGKYGDPYVIDDNAKLPILSGIIAGQNVGNTVQLYLPSDLTNYDYTDAGYTKYLYNFDATTLVSSDGGANQSNSNVRRYLAGAYFVITRSITLPADYTALGTASSAEYAFRGVLIGRGNPVVTNTSPQPLVYSSNGCVIKDLTVTVDVDYNNDDVIELAAPTGNATYAYSGGIQSYGAVIQQIMGGDTFIDNVNVTFTSATFSITTANSSRYPTLTPIGGYVGVIVNGGLIFRNMTSANVGLTTTTDSRVTNSSYLYINPLIGRVIAGYAFNETNTYQATESNCVLKNGEKNYTISDLSLSAGKLNVAYENGAFTITVPDGQALYVLGAIVNSGAASASYSSNDPQTTAYQALSDYWSAYREHTTARAGATYDAVGTSGFASADDYTLYAVYDTYTNDLVKVPYVIRAYSNETGSVYLARCLTTNANNKLVFSGNCDVAQGFRGIGSIYLNSDYVNLKMAQCTGRINNTSSSYQITLHMRYLEYNHKSVSSYIAEAASGSEESTAGFGLFNRLALTMPNNPTSDNSVQYLTLSGSVFYDVYTIDGVQAKYNFANYKNSGAYDRTEAGNITSGDTEDATLRRTLLSVGGLTGFVKSQFYIRNVTFNELYVEGAKTAGGLVGFTFQPRNSQKVSKIFYDDINVANQGFVNVVGGLQAGGLIGRIFRAGVEIEGATGGTDIIIRNVASKNSNPDESNLQYYANMNTGVGGLVGTCWAADGDGVVKPNLTPTPPTNVRKLFVNRINVVKGSAPAKVYVDNDSGTKNNYAGGFIGSAHNVWIQITNSGVEGVNVSANVAGGFIGRVTQKYYLYIEKCSADGSEKTATISGTRYAGGAVGWAIGRDFLYFQLLDFVTKDYNISSTSTASVQAGAGGVVGYAQGDNKSITVNENYICEFNNLTVQNCKIETNYTNSNDNTVKFKQGTGGMIGVIDTATDGKEGTRNSNNKYKFSGYNILIKDVTLSHLNNGETAENTAGVNRRIGDIVGNNGISSPLKFVGISVEGTTVCLKHVGYIDSTADNYGVGASSSDIGYLVFANFNATSGGITLPNVEDGGNAADNFTSVPAASPYVTVNPTLTIGGLRLTGDGIATSVNALPISSILNDTNNRYDYALNAYYSGSSGDNNRQAFSAFLSKFSMFSSEVSGYLGTDFPILIADDATRANSHKMINSYLRLLTNTTHDFGTDAAGLYSVWIYNVTYNGNTGAFTPNATGASLKRTNGEFHITNTAFDSGKTQFSLIDLRFYDPARGSDVAYHVYVPVFVKKVLSFSFDIAALSGTNYLESSYTYGKALIENVGTPVTLSFRYTYSRTLSEWESAINAGENVHRNYQKKLYFYKANTNAILKDFPTETVLVLVDPNRGGKPYYATIGTALSTNVLNLGAFREQMTAPGVFAGESFSPVNLEDMMTKSVTTLGNGEDHLVACETEYASVVVNGQGYRAATDEEYEDSTVTKYSVTLSGSNFVERYYLSVFTSSGTGDTLVKCESEDATFFFGSQGYRVPTSSELADPNVTKYSKNDLLFHYYLITVPTAFAETDYPSKILDTGAHTMVHLVMGKIFHHADLAVTSSTIRPTTVMTSENNALEIALSAQLGLSDDLDADIKSNMQTLIGATKVYQSFLVYLNRKEGNEVLKAIIGDPTVIATYSIDNVLNGHADNTMSAYLSDDKRLTQNHVEVVTPDLSTYFSSGNKFEINALVTLTYGSAGLIAQFPGRGPTSPNSGVTVSAASNVAFSSLGTTYSKNSVQKEETPTVSYYSEAEPLVAALALNSLGDRSGNFTPLGINPLNNGNMPTSEFDLLAVIEATAVEDQIVGYDTAKFTVKLLQKEADGTYGSPLDVSQYFTVSANGIAPVDDGTYYTFSIARNDPKLKDNGAEITLPTLHFSINTGSTFEGSNLTYSNYHILVEAVLQKQGVDIPASRVSNYIVYTNAKVVPYYIDHE